MNRTGIFVGIAVLVLAVAVVAGSIIISSAAAEDDGDRVFTNKSIEGRWGLSAQGTVLPPAVPVPTLAVAVGIVDFDGVGGCSITDTVNLGGTKIGPLTTKTCTYSVNSNGTGTLSFAFPDDPGPTPVSFVIVDNMREIIDIRTDQFAVAMGVLKRQ